MPSISEVTKDTRADKVSLNLGLNGATSISNSLTSGQKVIINENANLNILVIDCGIKNSQIRALLKHDVQLTLVDTNYHFIDEVLDKSMTVYF